MKKYCPKRKNALKLINSELDTREGRIKQIEYSFDQPDPICNSSVQIACLSIHAEWSLTGYLQSLTAHFNRSDRIQQVVIFMLFLNCTLIDISDYCLLPLPSQLSP